MVWNTIAHPKMMHDDHGGAGGISGTFSPIKFADTHKLSFYDIIVSMTGADGDRPILVKGDFETIKKMLLNDEAICGVVFESVHDDDGNFQKKTEIARVDHDPVLDCIRLYPVFGDPLYLLNDNTITMDSPTSGSGQPAGSDQSELMP